jgi:hypothetical protein
VESQIVQGELVEDKFRGWSWKTREGQIIPVTDMADSHLRNAALFLMGFGYSKCIANDRVRVAWLTILRAEWERRMLNRKYGDKSLVKWRG